MEKSFLVAVDKSGKEKNGNHQPDAKTGRPCLQARLLPCPIAVRTAAPAPFCGRLIKGCSDLVYIIPALCHITFHTYGAADVVKQMEWNPLPVEQFVEMVMAQPQQEAAPQKEKEK